MLPCTRVPLVSARFWQLHCGWGLCWQVLCSVGEPCGHSGPLLAMSVVSGVGVLVLR